MERVVIILLALAFAEASVSVVRSTDEEPHPSSLEIEVKLPSNKRFRIPLSNTDALDNATITVRENGVPMTFSGRQAHNADHAHYRDIYSKSVLSVRNENGKKRFSGHVMHDGKLYTVEPSADSEHRVTKRADLLLSESGLSRIKRQLNQGATDFEIEIHMLCDHTVWSTFKSIYGSDDVALMELHFYYTYILNGMDTALRNIENPSMSVRCVGLTVAKTQADAKWLPPAGSASVNDGGAMLSYIKAFSVGDPADHVMAFTRTDIQCRGNFNVVGLAFLGRACQKHKVSIVEDTGHPTWFTAVHELAHNLGADHDSNDPGCHTSLKYIMSNSAESYTEEDIANSYRFSPCSVKAMSNYLNSGKANCLRTRQSLSVPKLASSVREGVRKSLNQVCRLAYPSSPGIFFRSSHIQKKPALLCSRIFCSMKAGSLTGFSRRGLRAPVGYPCGSKKSCNWNGQCVPDESAPEADETCFFGDKWGDNCQGWKAYIKKLRDRHAMDRVKADCAKVLSGCCDTLKTLCQFDF